VVEDRPSTIGAGTGLVTVALVVQRELGDNRAERADEPAADRWNLTG
jgi:hypothetical protein